MRQIRPILDLLWTIIILVYYCVDGFLDCLWIALLSELGFNTETEYVRIVAKVNRRIVATRKRKEAIDQMCKDIENRC